MRFKEIRYEGVGWIHLVQDKDQYRSWMWLWTFLTICATSSFWRRTLLRGISCILYFLLSFNRWAILNTRWTFLEKLCDCQLLKKGRLPWSWHTFSIHKLQPSIKSFTLKMIAFWDISSYNLVEVGRRFRGAYYRALMMEARKHPWNVSLLLRGNTLQYPRRLSPSYSPQWEPEISVFYIIFYTEWELFRVLVWRGCLGAGGLSLVFSPVRESGRGFLAASVAPCCY
jgi:hypothetical protein